MHITFFIGGLSGGGAERVVCNLSNYLINKRHDVTIVTMSDDAPYEELNEKITRICLLENYERKSFVSDSILRYRRLKSFIKENNTSVYIVFLPVTIALLLSLRKIIKRPVVVSERNNPSSYSKIIQGMLKYFCRRADAFVFQTEDQKVWYSNYLNLDSKITAVIPNAVNITNRKVARNDNNGDFTIISAGRFSPQKNFQLLIESFAIVHENYPSYKLVIYGEGPLREKLEQQVAALGLDKNVAFPGFSRNLNEEMEKASMFVLTSDFEGIPNALIEAMQCGLPCVTTDCDGGGARLLIKDGVNGFLVEKGNSRAVADAIISIGRDKDLAFRLGTAANESLKDFSSDKIYGRWESFIANLCQ